MKDEGGMWKTGGGRRRTCHSLFFILHPSSFILSFLLLSGCGRPYNASVSGTVTIDGAALRTGTIAFSPIAGGAIAYALIGEDGRYSVRTGSDEGLLAGEYAAAVVAMSGRPPGSKNFRDFGTPLVPARYGDPKQSGLRFTIVPGVNHIDIPLRGPATRLGGRNRTGMEGENAKIPQ